MNTISKYITYAIAASILLGCSSLDKAPEGGTVTSEQREEVYKLTPEKVEAGVNGIATQFNAMMSIDEDSHNDFGYPSVMLMLDQCGYDMVSYDGGYNWQSSELDYTDRVYTSSASKIIWCQLYNQIYCANNVIASVAMPAEDNLSKYFLAQGLAFRAFSYWVLAQIYQFNYKDHKNKPCVPIITEENRDKVLIEGLARNTVEEVYDRILNDLNTAIGYLEDTYSAISPVDKRQISLETAYGLRARVYLTMEEWEKAAKDAGSALEIATASGEYPYTIEELQAGPKFWDSNDHSIMWAAVVAETDDVAQSWIVNWPSHICTLTYGYAMVSGGKLISQKLFNTISNTDVRKGWWLDENCESKNLTPKQQWYVSDDYLESLPYTNVKFAPYKDELQQTINAGDIPLMRVEEMYLIQAEAYNKSGNDAKAKQFLADFISVFRQNDYDASSYSGEALGEEIYRQRRIELWGEGLSWFDIMRLNKDIDRRGAGFDEPAVFNIKAGSDILLYRIPQCEIQSNKKITEADNNPVAPKPTPVPDTEF